MSLAFRSSNIGRIYVKPNTAEIESRKPTSKTISGFMITKIAEARGIATCTALLLPKIIAKREILPIIQALTIEDDNPERIANNQMTIRLDITLNFLGRKKKSLSVAMTSIVTLYPDAATIWLNPAIRVPSSKSLLKSLF